MDYKTLYEQSQKENKKLKSELMSLKELLHCDIPKMKREQDMKDAYWSCWSDHVDVVRGATMPDKEFVDSWCEDNNLLKDMDDLKSYLYGEFMLDEEDEELDPDEYGRCDCCDIPMTEDDFNNGTGHCESCDDVDLEKFD